MTRPPLKLSRLRDIGWAMWDPISLLPEGKSWANQPFADEYDRYLIEVASRLRRDGGIEDEVDYLVDVETRHMGMRPKDTTVSRAEATVRTIKAYVNELDGGQSAGEA